MDAAGQSVSAAVGTRLHVPDGLRAEASEGVGRDSLHAAVLLDVPEQHRQRHSGCKDVVHHNMAGNGPFQCGAAC